MKVASREEFADALRVARISKRLVRDLRYTPEEITYPEQRDFLVVTTKSGNEGVLLFEDRLVPIILRKRAANSRGRVEAIICDICATWQRGTRSASLTILWSSTMNVTHFVCANLECSLHVRDLTPESKISRTQLREHIDVEARIERLHRRLAAILAR